MAANEPTIDLDWNAATPPDPRILEVVARAQRDLWANPSSPHAGGRAVRAALEDARDQVARFLGVEPAGVTFTASGTEALNLAARGIPGATRATGARVVASAVEHKALLAPLEALARAGAIELALVPVDAEGRVEPEVLEASLGPGTVLACVLAAQNETGVLQPIDALHAVTGRAGVPLLVDAAQAAGRLRRDWRAAGWDYLVLSAHKMRAPRGAAALVRRRHAKAPLPEILGGGQELGRRAGTEDVAAIVGLGAACSLLETGETALRALRDRFEERLLAAIPGSRVAGRGAERLPQTVSLLVPEQRSEDLLAALDLAGVRASAGSACSSGALEPSHVLAAMNVPGELARGVVRLSFGPTTTEDELARAASILASVVARARNATAR
jgi:cysteine desulfurase